MEQVLVTTDFSDNADAAIRFGLQMAAQGEFTPVFMHVTEILKPVKWTEAFFRDFEQKELEGLKQQLKEQVMKVSADTGNTVLNATYVVRNSSSVPANIVHYAEEQNIKYICMARKGRGQALRLFGSTATTLMEKSSVPVIIVPEDYQPAALERVCYASDLSNLQDELQDVQSFSNQLKARLELLHFSSPVPEPKDTDQLPWVKSMLEPQQITLHIEAGEIDTPLADRLAKAVDQFKPSILVMFTRQERSFFERIFLSSISAEFAATADVPLLVYRKKR